MDKILRILILEDAATDFELMEDQLFKDNILFSSKRRSIRIYYKRLRAAEELVEYKN